MTQLYQMAATHNYWHATEQAEREQVARRESLAARARRHQKLSYTERSRMAFVPRIAGALGLF